MGYIYGGMEIRERLTGEMYRIVGFIGTVRHKTRVLIRAEDGADSEVLYEDFQNRFEVIG